MESIRLQLTLAVTLIIIFDCYAQIRPPFNNLDIPEDKVIEPADSLLESVESILNEVSRVDEFFSANLDKVQVMALTRDSEKPVIIENKQWPEGVITSFNILRNSVGQIYYYAVYPLSESGDWFIGYISYFDDQGRTIAFKRIANFFNSECVSGAAKEMSLYTFDQSFNVTSKSYSLIDSDNLDISDKQCWFNYDYKYEIGKVVEEVAKGI